MNHHHKPTLLLMDFNNIFYRGSHVHRNLSHNGFSTGGMYGFVSQVTSTINDVKPLITLMCDDSKPYLRTKSFPRYKAKRNRDQTKEEASVISINTEACRTFLKHAGIPTVSRRGMEADDIFALIAKRYSRDYKIVIASNDTDLYQLLDYCKLYGGHKKGYYDKRNFFRDWPKMRKVKDWPKVSAIAGSHNGVPQLVYGIGPKTAVDLLNQKNKTKNLKELMDAHGQDYERNLKLCVLPYPGSDPIKRLPRMETPDKRSVIRLLANFGIQYTSFMADAIEGN